MSVFVNKITNLHALHDYVLVSDMNFSERITTGGIVLPADDARDSGIRPRWAQVFATGPQQHDVTIGQWICVAHGRWTRGVTIETDDGRQTVRRIDPNDILLVSDNRPNDDTVSDKV